jgi:DNA repair exonuclease SbcCD ATPase subunit
MNLTRLMCSTDRNEIEFVKKELYRSGILTEIRINPLAAALRVTRLELWLRDERDFLLASKLYRKLQERIGECQELTGADNDTVTIVTAIDPQPTLAISAANRTVSLREMDPEAAAPRNNSESPDELEQASVLLEQEIEALLAREKDLEQKYDSLQGRVNALTESLAEAQAQVAREAAAREMAEKKAAALADSQGTLQCELREIQHELQTRDQALAAAKTDLQAKVQESRTHHTKIAELKKDLVETHNQLVTETESRMAAEERAAKLASAQEQLEQQLAEQTRLQQQVRAYVGNLNSLRNRLQTKKSARPGS